MNTTNSGALWLQTWPRATWVTIHETAPAADLNSCPSLMKVGPSCRMAPRSHWAVPRALSLFLASLNPPG